MSDTAASPTPDDDPFFEAVAEYMKAVQSGNPPEKEAFLARYPQYRDKLEEFLADYGKVGELLNSPALVDGGRLGAPPPFSKSRTFGNYELLDEIARGGMGIVYKACHQELGRLVALKMILAGSLASAAEMERFVIETRAAAHLDHPNIVPILETGEIDGQRYTMPLIEGENLAYFTGGKPMEPRRAATLIAALAHAVHHAHERGVLHRDLKPANILIDSNNTPHITDFGLAKLVDDDLTITKTGAIVGTPTYMSPELASGDKSNVTASTDIYSLGAILYELVTGRPPFRAATSFETVEQVKYREPERPRSSNPLIERDLDTICLRCLEKNPRHRYESARALAADLECYLEGRPITARPVSGWERAWKWARRRPAVASLIALTIIFFVSALVGTLWYNAILRASIDLSNRRLFTADVNLAMQAWNEGQVEYMRSILERHIPKEGQKDLRGFAWHHLWGRTSSLLLSVKNMSLCWRMAFGPGGRLLVTSHIDGDVVLWDVHAATKLRNLEANNQRVSALAFSPNGKQVAGIRGEDHAELVLWNVDNGRKAVVFDTHEDILMSLAFPHDDLLITSTDKSEVLLWNINSRQNRREKHPGPPIVLMEITAGGELLLMVDMSNQLTSLSIKNPPISSIEERMAVLGRRICLVTEPWLITLNNTSMVLGAARSDRGIVIASGDDFDSHSPELLISWASKESVHTYPKLNGPLRCAAFTPDGQRLVTGGKHIKIWDFQKLLEPSMTIRKGTDMAVALAPEGGVAAYGIRSGKVALLDLSTGMPRTTVRTEFGPIRRLAFDPGGNRLAVAGSDRTVLLWDPGKLHGDTPLGVHLGAIWSLAFHPHEQLLAVGSFRQVLVWDLGSKRAQELRLLADRVQAMGFSPEGERLWAGCADGSLACWKVADWSRENTIAARSNAVTSLTLSKNNHWLAVGGDDGSLHLHDQQSGKHLLSLRGHSKKITSLTFSPTEDLLASASLDVSIKLWDITTGQLRLSLDAHDHPIDRLQFSRDGTALIGMDRTGVIHTWHAPDTAEALEHELRIIDAFQIPATPDEDLLSGEATDWTLLHNPALDVNAGCQGLAWGDADGDGDLDLYLARNGPDRLILNEDGQLSDVTPAIFQQRHDSMGVVWGDLDNDGDLDLVIADRHRHLTLFKNSGSWQFIEDRASLSSGPKNSRGIALADYDGDGDLDIHASHLTASSVLLHNDGAAGFSRVFESIMSANRRSRGSTWADYDNDGHLDLYMPISRVPNYLFHNEAGLGFSDRSTLLNSDKGSGSARCGAWGDYDNDGDLDLYICRSGSINRLLRNEGGESFIDVTVPPLNNRGLNVGAIWGDYDNDGDLDLFIGDNDGASKLLRNDGGGISPEFTDVTTGPLHKTGSVYAMSWADYDDDGDLDLTVSDWDDAVQLFRNDLDNGCHWLHVRLIGVKSNTSGIGARLRLTAGGLRQIREITGGSSCASKPLLAMFGLGNATRVESLEIRWPSGTVQRLENIPVDQLLVVREE